MNFDQAVNIILKYEGGYVNNPNDPGGETNYGISRAAFPHLDIKNLTIDQAKNIYKLRYWDPIYPDNIPDRLRLVLFDCAVNQGAGRAVRFMQEAVGTRVDGIIGPKTIKALQDCNVDEALSKVIIGRHLAYARLSTWKLFGKGWSKRLLEVTIASYTPQTAL